MKTKNKTRLTKITFFVDDVEFNLEVDPSTRTGNVKTAGLRADGEYTDDERYNAAVDALESLVLAYACEGGNVLDPKFTGALHNSIEAIANNLT